MQNNEYFNRQIKLLGEDKNNILMSKKILIIGCGGLGNSLAFALSGLGLRQIDLIDYDKVELSNIARQIAFGVDDVGKNKTTALKEQLQRRCPFTKFNIINKKFDNQFNTDEKYDLIIDASDNLKTRECIDNFAKKTNTPWLFSSVERFHGYTCLFEKAKFSDVFNIKDLPPAGISSAIVMYISSFSANIAMMYLSELPCASDVLYYNCFNIKTGEYSHNKLKVF